MSRKRSNSTILDDDSRPIAIPSRRIRSNSCVLNENPARNESDLVVCNCSKCN